MRRQGRHGIATVVAIMTGMLFVASSAYASQALPDRIASLNAADRVSVSGPRVAYADMTESAGWDVFIEDAVSQRTHRIGGVGDQLSADIDGTLVVYTDFVEGHSDIRGYDVVEGRAFDICMENGNQTRPRISGDWVIWNELGVGSTGALVALNLRTAEQVVIADKLAANADIAGDTVVFEDHTGSTPSIRIFNLADKTGRLLAAGGTENVMPATDGTWVAWVTEGVDGYDIAFQRLADKLPVVLPRAGEQTLPGVSAGKVSFTERNAGSAMSVVTMELATSAVSGGSSDDDVVGYDSDGSAHAAITRAGSDRWALSAELPSVSVFTRLRAALGSAWRAVTPARYAAWTPEAPTFSAAGGAEQAAALRRPTIVSARVSGPKNVTIVWESPRSLRGVRDFDVYRSTRPITAKTIKSAKKVASGVTATRYVDEISPSAETTAKASAHYYAVIAWDHDGTASPLSASISPNPHGADMYSASGVESCGICHSVHRGADATQGALGALSADRCYDCHGSTQTTDRQGAGSFFDTQAGFRDDATNTAGPRLAGGGSIHRNSTMVQKQRECTACHDAHARPYAVNAKGAYDKASSSAKMLRTHVGKAASKKSWSDADPAGNRVCLTCHGSTITPIALVGGTSAYASSGGDHKGSGTRTYANSAHAGVESGGSSAEIQCLVCHNQHGSATARLVDFRQSNTADPNANKQANLCYRCHNSDTANTWNGRDVRTEFTRASRHPSVAATATGSASATCVSCHNTHFAQKGSGVWDASRVSDPLNTPAGVSDTTSFCLRCHSKSGTDGAVKVAAIASASKLVPYEIRMRPSNLWPYFSGWGKAETGTEFVKSGHATASVRSGRAGCETCHDPHASDFSALTAWTRPEGASITGGLSGSRANSVVFADRSEEENLCYQCHGNGSQGSGKAAGAADVMTPAQGAFAHPIEATGVHDNAETAADLVSSRHAECIDCHDPHSSRRGTRKANSSVAGESLRGAVGVKPSWAGGNWSDVSSLDSQRIVPGTGDDYEAYLCLKCHSGPTTTGTSGSAGFRTNIAREFNPRNFSYHRVLGAAQAGVRDRFKVTSAGSGTQVDVSWAFPGTNVFKPGIDRDTMMACTSCHGSSTPGQASGPHGSSSKYMLDPAYGVDWNSTSARLLNTTPGMPEDLVCSKCHTLTDSAGRWGNNVHAEHAEKGGTASYCRNCHVGVPHGWKRPRLLGYTTDEFPYNTWRSKTGSAASGDWGLTRVKVKATTSPQGWVAGDCYAGCHDVHGSSVRSYWP